MTTSQRPVVRVQLPPNDAEGLLGLPEARPRGIVLFAHGSGSSRHSPRNAFVAAGLRQAGFATLLFDLLSEREAADRANVFDIALLSGRLCEAADWTAGSAVGRSLPLGLFGASTGAAAALMAASLRTDVRVVVSRGGRPDLAGNALARVTAATLLIVGGSDLDVLALNQLAYDRLHCVRRLDVVPGATHLFEEPGALEAVVALARDWLLQHMTQEQAGAGHDIR